MPPGLILFQLVMLALPVGALGFFGWLGIRFVKAKEREAANRLGATPHPDLLDGLQEAVAALQAEVHGIRERQEFIEKLLDKPRAQEPGRLPPW